MKCDMFLLLGFGFYCCCLGFVLALGVFFGGGGVFFAF